MPHDKNNVKIRVGDVIKAPALNPALNGDDTVLVGRVLVLMEGQSCSGRLAHITKYGGIQIDYFSAADAEIIYSPSAVENK